MNKHLSIRKRYIAEMREKTHSELKHCLYSNVKRKILLGSSVPGQRHAETCFAICLNLTYVIIVMIFPSTPWACFKRITAQQNWLFIKLFS